MDQAYVVRHKVLVEGLSVRRLAREFRISRNTVKRYVAGAVPGERMPARPPIRPAYEAARLRIGELLAESPRWTSGKQRLTAARLHQLVVADGHAVGETVVKELSTGTPRRALDFRDELALAERARAHLRSDGQAHR